MTRRNDILAATRLALAWWAACSRSELPGWPTKSIMASVLTGVGTRGGSELPDDVKAVEAAVNSLYRSDPAARRMILLHYLSSGSAREKIKHLGVGSKGYYARLEHAEYAVKIELGY